MNDKTMLGKIQSLLSFFGGVGGLLAISLVIWRGGAIERQQEINTKNANDWAEIGKPKLAEHIKADDESRIELQRRVTRLEELIAAVARMDGKFDALGIKLDGLREELNRHENTTMQHFQQMRKTMDGKPPDQ